MPLASSISTSPSGGCSSRDVTFPFFACLSALLAMYALAPADPGFRVPPDSPAARPARAPAPLELSLAGLQALMELRFVVPPLAFSWGALAERVLTAHFAARTAVAGLAGLAMYLLFATAMHALFPRRPVVNKRERAMFDLSRWDSDLSLGVLGIVCGSPIQQGFVVLKESFGFSLAYANIADGRVELPGGLVLEGWAWWAVSLPVYLVLFDLVFYWTHLILHWGPVYRTFHANHHAFRPPTAWSGIAIDPVENVLTGMMPLHIPLFLLPFHLHTVFAINIVLLGWATLLHSGCGVAGGWLFIGPQDHNVHHARGLENRNFSAIFSGYDWLFGTLDREGWTQNAMVPFWTSEDRARAAAASAKGAAAAKKSLGDAGEEDPAPLAAPAARAPASTARRRSVVRA